MNNQIQEVSFDEQVADLLKAYNEWIVCNTELDDVEAEQFLKSCRTIESFKRRWAPNLVIERHDKLYTIAKYEQAEKK